MKTLLEGKIKIKAVHDADLNSFLARLALLDRMQNGQLRCAFCDCVLTFDNFGGVFKENGILKPFCQKTECYFEVLKRKSGVKEEPING
ncbi:MAG: hypothetical protein AB1393_02990 [Candidatus Edwardsbacteria bacterium]